MSQAFTHIAEIVRRPVAAFADRADAGAALARFIAPVPDPGAVVLAIPRGGVPVARPLADVLGCLLAPMGVRKLPIPTDPEMGFGAVTVDGTVTLNAAAVRAFGITEREQREVVGRVRDELDRRAFAYPGSDAIRQVGGRSVWLVDDGLATGFSALAACRAIRAHGPRRLALAVPCAMVTSIERLAREVDEVWCVFAQEVGPFAVASYYLRFADLTDEEVRRALLREPPHGSGSRARLA